MRFEFGKNWQRYLQKHYSEKRVEISKTKILEFLEVTTLEGKTFLDLGCGSGIHSLAALRVKAKKVTSIDVDQDSIRATHWLQKKEAWNTSIWEVRQGSVLDEAFMLSLERANLVYAWGSLHHTGDLWRALDLTSRTVAEGGELYLAVYDEAVFQNPLPAYWIELKQRYNGAGFWKKRWMEVCYIWQFDMNGKVWRLPSLFKRIWSYSKNRGMDYYTDTRDWLGGYPIEFARREDVICFFEKRGFVLKKIATGHANAEYLLARISHMQ